MPTTLSRRVVQVSAGKVENLSKDQVRFLDAFVEKLRSQGLEIAREAPTGNGINARYEANRSVDGIAVVAFSQWSARRLNRQPDRECILPSEFVHIVNTMAIAARKPLLVLTEKDIAPRGSLRDGYVPRPLKLPRSLRTDWLASSEFEADFANWLTAVKRRRHVFLGYASEADPLAKSISAFLTASGVDILDWHLFKSSGLILNRIEEAAQCTTCGIFLFTASDQVNRETGPSRVPRDNVVFELGYFAGQKGLERTLVIVEEGTEIPTDLGGFIHVPLTERHDIRSIKTHLTRFVADNLGSR